MRDSCSGQTNSSPSISNIPSELKYAKSHEWLRAAAEGAAVVGISDYAQNSLGDITFVQLPQVGAQFKAGDTFGVVESVKAASDVYAPLAGTVVEVNPALVGSPEKVNSSPYADGWMIKLQLVNPADIAGLLSADDYGKLIG